MFRNRRGTAIKLLAYDGQGFWLCQKRFSEGRLQHWPESRGEVQRELLAHELAVLLMGGDPDRTRRAAVAARDATAHAPHEGGCLSAREDRNTAIETTRTSRKGKDDEPDIASVDMAQVQSALARVRTHLGPADFELFQRLVSTLMAVAAIVSSQRAMLSRLRRLFGLSSSERSRDVLGDGSSERETAPARDATTDQVQSAETRATGAPEPESSGAHSEGDKRKGHGRLPVSLYEAATHIAVAHPTLQVGGSCPACFLGKLYELNTTAPNLQRMIAKGRAVLRLRGHRRRGHSPFKVTAKPQGGAERARAAGNWEQ